MKTKSIFLILLLFSIALPWYSRINTEEEFYEKEDIDIPISEAINEMTNFNQSKSYRKERHIRGMKRRTWIPYVYKYDTLTTSSFMYYSKEIE